MHAVIFANLVLIVQFASTTFSALESSGEISFTIVITGGTPSTELSIGISYTMLTTTG